jgi:hypothetical protein
MRKLRTVVLATAGTLLVATAALAATTKMHSMRVALPDGSVAHVEYAGDVAPTVNVEPAGTMAAADPFADMDAVFAAMQQQSLAMMQRAAQMERQAASGAAPGQITVSSNLPAGSYHYSFVSTTTSGNGCTQTVEYRSDGSRDQPQVTRASSGDCDSVGRGEAIVPAAATQPQAGTADGRTI